MCAEGAASTERPCKAGFPLTPAGAPCPAAGPRCGSGVRVGAGAARGARPYLAISPRAPPAAGRPVAALSHGGGRNGRGARPRSSPYLVKQATHWPAGQRRSRPVRAETPRLRAWAQRRSPPWGRRGKGGPAGAEPQPDLLTRCTGRRRCDLSVLQPGSARPRPRSGRGRSRPLCKLAAPPLLEQELRMLGFREPAGQGQRLQGCQKWACLPL